MSARSNSPSGRSRPELLAKPPSLGATGRTRAKRRGRRGPPSGLGLRPAGAPRGAFWPWPPHLAIVADEHHAVAGVYGPRTEVTLLDTHVEGAWGPATQTPGLKGTDVTLPPEKILCLVPDPEEEGVLRSCGPLESNPSRMAPPRGRAGKSPVVWRRRRAAKSAWPPALGK